MIGLGKVILDSRTHPGKWRDDAELRRIGRFNPQRHRDTEKTGNIKGSVAKAVRMRRHTYRKGECPMPFTRSLHLRFLDQAFTLCRLCASVLLFDGFFRVSRRFLTTDNTDSTDKRRSPCPCILFVLSVLSVVVFFLKSSRATRKTEEEVTTNCTNPTNQEQAEK